MAALLLSVPRAGSAQVETQRESQVKAAFLFNFGQFVSWPSDTCPATREPFVIGVLGSERVGDALAALSRGARIQDRAVAVARYASVDDVGACQILFVSASEAELTADAFAELAARNVLIVGETPDFAVRDGVIALRIVDNRMRMEVNTTAASAARLTISSKLLRLADVVRAPGS